MASGQRRTFAATRSVAKCGDSQLGKLIALRTSDANTACRHCCLDHHSPAFPYPENRDNARWTRNSYHLPTGVILLMRVAFAAFGWHSIMQTSALLRGWMVTRR
jgi:hypothetical protein